MTKGSHISSSVESVSQRACLSPEEALQFVIAHFPFRPYIDPRAGGHLNVARCARRYLEPGAKVLDFGSGPCDKAAILQAMGFECFAYDDLQDAWHTKADNQEQIRAFADFAGVRFTAGSPAMPLPYPRGYFDMVMLNDVIEHLHDSPRELLNDLLEVTKTNGLLFITVPNAANIRKRLALLCGATNYQRFDLFYCYPGHWRGHIREYVKDDLLQLSKYLNLEVVELRGCDHMLRRVRRPMRTIYLGITTMMNSWKDSWLLIARKPNAWKASRSPSPQEDLPLTYLFGD